MRIMVKTWSSVEGAVIGKMKRVDSKGFTSYFQPQHHEAEKLKKHPKHCHNASKITKQDDKAYHSKKAQQKTKIIV
jgi:hypothetical protein